MNILIIGANGFTGRRILNDLVAREIYNITACSLRNDIQSGDGYQFIRADIRNASEVRALFKEVCPDVVINTSALSYQTSAKHIITKRVLPISLR